MSSLSSLTDLSPQCHIMASQPTPTPWPTPYPPEIRPYKIASLLPIGFPCECLIRPLFLKGWYVRVGRLTSHYCNHWCLCVGYIWMDDFGHIFTSFTTVVKALNSRYGFHALCSGRSKSNKDVLQGVQGAKFLVVKVVETCEEDEHIIDIWDIQYSIYILPVMLRTHE